MMRGGILASIAILFLATSAFAVYDSGHDTEIYFFWGQGCPACKDLKPVLDDLEYGYKEVTVKSFEVYNSRENLNLLQDMMSAYGRHSNSVPVTFISDTMIDGFFPGFTDKRIEKIVGDCVKNGCISPSQKLDNHLNPPIPTSTTTISTSTTLPHTGAKNRDENGGEKVIVRFFWGEGCPYCERQKTFLNALADRYPEVEVIYHNAFESAQSAEYFQDMAKAHGIRASGVPITFIGKSSPVIGYGGDLTTGRQIEEMVKQCIDTGCIDPAEKLKGVDDKDARICIHAFIRMQCPQCNEIMPYLESLESEYDISISVYDVSEPENERIYGEFKRLYGLEYAAHPVVFIGNSYFIGVSAIRSEIEGEIRSCINDGCTCPKERIRGLTSELPGLRQATKEDIRTLDVPVFGEVELESAPLFALTFMIAFIDGLNPCSLWVLTFLLGIVINARSRKRILIVGLTFLIVTATAYGVFIVGMLNVFLYISYIWWIRLAVASLALIFAAVNIKDYFWYKKGISFTISDEHKPGLIAKVRNIRQLISKGSTASLVFATAVMALGITLVELPCTAGLPVIWTNIIAERGVSQPVFIGLLMIYLLTYLMIELVIFTGFLITLKTSKMEEKHGRSLKLLGGVIMLTLGLVMLFDPELMDDVASTIQLFAAAIGFTFAVLYIHRIILPKYGIVIGTEDLETESQAKW